jgi:uncharacterized membrane protein
MKRPRSITIISLIFIVFGSIALIAGLLPYGEITVADRLADLQSHWYVHASRILQVCGGVFMLYGFNWARWLVVVWIAFHIVVGALHSPFQLLTHVLIFSVILYFLFRPNAAAYFRGKGTTIHEITRSGTK